MSTKHTINYLTNFFPLELGEENNILRLISDPLTVDDLHTEPTQLLCEALHELMREYDGVGLAAPQIGHNKRIISVTRWK
jgi:peptide deformylase